VGYIFNEATRRLDLFGLLWYYFYIIGLPKETIQALQNGCFRVAAIIRKDVMSRTCDICGKHTITGNKVSHAKNHTRRTWKPNLKKIKTEIDGTTITLKICTRCLKSDIVTKKV
jgi:large subunit ribosomal protein L28